MKIQRKVRMMLVALTGATMTMGLATSMSATPNIPDMIDPTTGAIHKVVDYQLVSTVTMNNTMGRSMGGALQGQRVRSMTWECWVQHDPITRLPILRRTAWLIGGFKNANGSFANWPRNQPVDLHDIGAQHRSATLYLRVTTTDPQAKVSLKKVEDRYKHVPLADLKEADQIIGGRFDKFYIILPSRPAEKPLIGLRYDTRYVLTSSDPTTIIEVCYEAHPPGDMSAQTEDGGPPSVPPSNEN